MKIVLQITIAVLLTATASVSLACGGSDDDQKNDSEAIREVEIQSLAAYACMPKELRRELRELERRHDARVRQLARASRPRGTTDATPAPGFEQTVESDPVRGRLLRKARAIYRRYSPGGDDYNPGCFLREREQARRRLEDAGTTGPVGTTN